MSFLRRRGVIAGGAFRPIVATGGNIVEDEEIDGVLYRLHIFTTVGSSQAFEVQSAGTDGLVEYLIVAGGGAGGDYGAGGGAGGYRSSVSGELSGRNSSAEPRFKASIDTYPVVVGAGGVGQTFQANALSPNGGDSSVFGIVSTGGGGGGKNNTFAGGGNEQRIGRTGGSAGGSGRSAEAQPIGIAGQGFGGGCGGADSGPACDNAARGNPKAGGGGGAAAAGQNGGIGSGAAGGNGGNGLTSNITGTPTVYAAGGGGQSFNGPGGVGGSSSVGGNGGANDGVAAKPNGDNGTGSGGGGQGTSGTAKAGDGGSGIVIIRYPLVRV